MKTSEELALPIKVFDFFSGCGGTCVGFKRAGLDVVCALDVDHDARKTFSLHPAFRDVPLEPEQIQRVDAASIQSLIDDSARHPVLFSGCAPCQPFSKQNRNRNGDARSPLLLEFLRFVLEYKPDYVFVENVAGIH
jgi:DNA (cytosine-5)-methyltransferase 1